MVKEILAVLSDVNYSLSLATCQAKTFQEFLLTNAIEVIGRIDELIPTNRLDHVSRYAPEFIAGFKICLRLAGLVQ